ncbi:coiled-coil domain-containing protein 174 [Lycorma delicatula]|uniref:coiled-coil domain-containing protein 174 n=1 Tax=Lycorma delicatula TaxID=130591 RepID=UPI003F5147BD
MNTSKSIDISKSSLISLKAELSRKQDEVQKAKVNKPTTADFMYSSTKLKKSHHKKQKKEEKEKVNADSVPDNDATVEDDEALKRSRSVLEIKSKLYEHLQDGKLVADHGKSEYLVNFDQKQRENDLNVLSDPSEKKEEEEELSDSDPPSDPENDWVDFTDVLGRSRRCLRKDLEYMKQKDDKLAKNLKPPTPPPLPTDVSSSSAATPEMLSNDMHREMMRRKWEEQEKKLLNKTDVHYQDLLFDEARTHGVGYYNFSTDEDERIKQQRELLRLRQETLKRQEETQSLRERRNQQLQSRIRAARLRNRQRLGLPPEEENCEESEDVKIITETDENKTDDDKESTSEKLDELENALKRAAHVRPWDVGKDGVKPNPVMSQEEWVEKRREERDTEFAPPSIYELKATSSKRSQSGLYFSSKKLFTKTSKNESASTSAKGETFLNTTKLQIIKNEVPETFGSSSTSNYNEELEDKKVESHKRAEVPPPLTMEYYGGDIYNKKKFRKINTSSKDMEDSITEGLKYLQKETEIKEKKRDKGLLDVI